MWGRETVHEAQDDSAWENALEEILEDIPAQPQLHITCDDPHLIRDTIERMKIV